MGQTTKPPNQSSRITIMGIDLSNKKYKYDQVTGRLYHLIILGIIINVALYFYPVYGYGGSLIDDMRQHNARINFGMRIIAAVIAVNSLTSRNRSGTIGLLALPFPGITLIVVGFWKKKVYPSNYSKLSDEEKSKINRQYSFRLCRDDQLELALDFINEAIRLDDSNASNYCIKGMILTHAQAPENDGLEELKKSLDMGSINDELYIGRGKAFMKHDKSKLASEDFMKAVGLENKIQKKVSSGDIDYSNYGGELRKIKKNLKNGKTTLL